MVRNHGWIQTMGRDEKSMKVVKSHEGKVHHYMGDRNKKESYLKAFK